METARVYPYLGRGTVRDGSFVVWFTEVGKGIIVQSDIADDEKFALGKYGEFDETWFQLLSPDVCVRISNNPTEE